MRRWRCELDSNGCKFFATLNFLTAVAADDVKVELPVADAPAPEPVAAEESPVVSAEPTPAPTANGVDASAATTESESESSSSAAISPAAGDAGKELTPPKANDAAAATEPESWEEEGSGSGAQSENQVCRMCICDGIDEQKERRRFLPRLLPSNRH